MLLVTATALLVAGCNAAVGGGVVALVGGAGFLANQCYDRVRVRVRDPHTGNATCSADVWLSDGDSERRLRPCYNAALTEGTWKLTARLEGYEPASTELTIPDHEGDCPSYVHSVELTLRRPGEPREPAIATPSRSAEAPAPAAPNAAGELDTPRSRVIPPPLPGVPTKAFDPTPAAPAAPATPAPAPASPAAPAPPPAPATPPGPAPSTPAPAPGTPAPH